MMRKQASALAALSFLSASVFAQPSGARAVSVDEQKAYLRWLLPLPKEVTFLGKTRVAVGSLRLVLDSNASDSFVTAADDLRALLKEKAGVDAPAAPEKAFTIRLGLRGSKVMEGVRGIPDLSGLPNAEQAYAIVPIRETGERLAGYALVGQGEPGAYYAAQTFGQLLEGALHKAKVADEIELPVVAIRDWPDLGERGFWGSYGPGNAQDIAFMARRRFNLVETHTPRRFTEGGAYTAAIDPGLMAAARKHAVKLVPVITHLDHLPKSLFEKLPELLAKGEKGKVGELQAACHAHPAYQKLLNDWMRSLAEHEGVEDVCAWLSELENCPRCSCDECSRENWFAGEARLLVRAWQEARKVEPTLRLRILLTQGSYSHNDLVLKAVPPEVGISYYSGVHTYSVSREPMIYPLLREFAQGGRWLGVYPQLLAVWAYNTPFSCPQLVQFRAKEFVDAGLKNVCWRLHPQEWPYFAMNFDAAAEWSWNAKGRSVSEFAEAWAVRQGFKDAGKVVEWAEVLGPVAWDVHEGGFPLNLPKVTRSLGAAPLKLGEGAFQAFPTVERFEQDLNACQRAMSLAKEIASPILTAETQVMTNYVSLLKSLYQLSERLAATSEITAADRAALEKTMALFKASHSSLLDGLRAWYAAVQKERGAPPWRLDSTPKEIKENCDRIHELCAWLSAQSKGTLRVLMNGFGKPETLGGRTAFNSDETGRGDGRAGWASFNFVVKDFTKSFELHLSVWGKSDPLNLIICAEGQGKGRSEGGKWTPVEAQGMLSGQEQWDHLVYRLTPELYDRAGPRQTVGLGGGDSQIWISECWLEGK